MPLPVIVAAALAIIRQVVAQLIRKAVEYFIRKTVEKIVLSAVEKVLTKKNPRGIIDVGVEDWPDYRTNDSSNDSLFGMGETDEEIDSKDSIVYDLDSSEVNTTGDLDDDDTTIILNNVDSEEPDDLTPFIPLFSQAEIPEFLLEDDSEDEEEPQNSFDIQFQFGYESDD